MSKSMTLSRISPNSRPLDDLLELELRRSIEEVKTNLFSKKTAVFGAEEMKEYDVLLEFVRNFERGRWKRLVNEYII